MLLLRLAQRQCPSDPVVYLHLAEHEIHQNQFDSAVKFLRKAKKFILFQKESLAYDASSRLLHSIQEVEANVYALLGVTLFRLHPNRPEVISPSIICIFSFLSLCSSISYSLP